MPSKILLLGGIKQFGFLAAYFAYFINKSLKRPEPYRHCHVRSNSSPRIFMFLTAYVFLTLLNFLTAIFTQFQNLILTEVFFNDSRQS